MSNRASPDVADAKSDIPLNRRRTWLPMSWTQRWHEARAPLVAWWAQRAPRERTLLALCILISAAALTWLAGVEPALNRLRHWQTELPRLRAQATEIEAVAQQAQADRRAPSKEDAGTAPANEQAIVASLDRARLKGTYTVSRMAPPTDPPAQMPSSRWQVSFSNAPIHDLVPWLLDAPRALGLAAQAAHLERPGVERPVPSGITRVTPSLDARAERDHRDRPRPAPGRLSGTVELAPPSPRQDKD